ncbi:hypothetical protein LWI29_024297 [Acer saccharum]|uniref:Uncharacterized protein n=1 Tax=Acer saccharum TaxID=4024 RepID=A0AA39SMW7_ACESA|nr:hypothetical protein LWI29_024297 [Acer saccharum]
MEVSGDSRGYGRRNIARASSYGGRTEGDQFFGVQQQPYKSYAEVVLDQKKRSQGSGQDNIERVISIRIRMTEDPAPVDHWWLSSLLGLQTSKAQSFSDKPDMDRADSSFKKVAEKVSALSSLEGRTLDIEKVNGPTTCGIIQISNKSVDQDKFRRGKVKESRGVRKVNRYHFKLSKKRGGLGVLDKGKGRLISKQKQKQKPRVFSFCNASFVIGEKTGQTGVEESDIETSSSELKGRSGFFLLKGECSRRANPIGPKVTDSVGLSGPSNQGVELREINDGLQDQADNLSRPDKASLIGEHERGMLLGQDHSSDNGQGFNSRNSHLGLVKNISGVNSGIYVDPTSGMEDGEMKILEVGNSDRKMESGVHDMRRRASSGVPDPPNSIKRS